jgi:hypothetical protein
VRIAYLETPVGSIGVRPARGHRRLIEAKGGEPVETIVIQKERPGGGEPAAAVVTANGVTRRYGEGDTCVKALRGVSLEIARGQLTALGPRSRS